MNDESAPGRILWINREGTVRLIEVMKDDRNYVIGQLIFEYVADHDALGQLCWHRVLTVPDRVEFHIAVAMRNMLATLKDAGRSFAP